ncbi:hypothetical protein B0H13DRAFT_2649919 [Mycena leptocephala]|nr:hypothetical protein B0H13DRAFT_2649919 [Mycena leptocephala]
MHALQVFCVTALLSSALILASAQTLYTVSPAVPSQTVIEEKSISISRGGVGADGATIYVEVDVETSLIMLAPSETITVFSVPTTLTQTFVEDASHWRGSEVINGSVLNWIQTCTFGSDGEGTCARNLAKQTTTFSGSLVPYHTLPESSSPSTTSPQGSTPTTPTSPNAAPMRSAFTGWNVLLLLVVEAIV